MIDLSKVGHKGPWAHVLQWFIRTIWAKDERCGGAAEDDLIISIRLEFGQVSALKLCHHIFCPDCAIKSLIKTFKDNMKSSL